MINVLVFGICFVLAVSASFILTAVTMGLAIDMIRKMTFYKLLEVATMAACTGIIILFLVWSSRHLWVAFNNFIAR